LVPRVRIYFDELNDFLPKPANETGVIPAKTRHKEFVETFFFLLKHFGSKKAKNANKSEKT
jgi:hypothetical protein